MLAEEEAIREDLRYRDRQLLRLKDEVLDLEDLNESVSLTDFTLDDFRMELSRFIEANRQVLRDAPLGLYSIVPTDAAYPVIRPGVIFCLKQKNAIGSTATQTNPLQPYFLAYVLAGGEVRYSFAQPKQILEIYRVLCAERSLPYAALCDAFDGQTHQGQDMSVYNALLESAAASIMQTSRRRSLAQLQTNRGAVIGNVQEQMRSSTDFELITWLVVQDGEENPCG
ncbi:MAG: hypothetical protein HC781_15840 [Leptolyngbyaceae cyanobacterium CSU_1_4]|nr:hypothetical protein [Leptolyngbyaceae cyanobacterium CSU_1_4]